MWYGFLGPVLTGDALFEAKMSELCRDLGDRGRRSVQTAATVAMGAAVVAGSNDKNRANSGRGGGGSGAGDDDGNGDDNPAIAALRSELRGLRVSDLRKRAVAAGVDGSSAEAALDSDDPKAALVDLLVRRRMEVGAVADVIPALEEGGEDAAAVLGACLDHAVEVLDMLSTSLPRRERKPVIELLDRVEAVSGSASSVEWCAGLSQCGESEISRLGSAVVGVTALSLSAPAATDSVRTAMLELLECVDRCGNAVLQALAVLSAGGDGEQSEDTCVMALEALGQLSNARQDENSKEEVSAAVLVLPHMVEGRPLRVRACANMALFTLGCRRGRRLMSADILDHVFSHGATMRMPLLNETGAGMLSTDALALYCASAAVLGLLFECVSE
eukprot:SAG22_NODE_825_length_6973_cov_2.846523_2_plen_388_part_00